MRTLKDVLADEMSDPAFRTAFEEAKLELEEEERVAKALADDMTRARKRARLTQTQVAERMRTTQSAVARMESGREEPSPSRLRAYARAIGAELHIEFRPHPGDGT